MANIVLAHKTMKEKKIKKNNDYKQLWSINLYGCLSPTL